MDYITIIIGVVGFALVIAIINLVVKQAAAESISKSEKNLNESIYRSHQDLENEIQNINRSQIQELARNRAELADILDNNNQNIARIMEAYRQSEKDSNNALIEQLKMVQESNEKAILRLTESNEKRLDRMQETVDEKLHKTLEERLGQSFALVSERLQEVYKGLGEMQSLASGVGDLKKVLSNVKTRGILGEIQLGAILESILAPAQYDSNVVTVPGTKNPVEYAVKLPGLSDETVYLPIDSKFPGDIYEQLLNAYDSGSSEAVIQCKKALEYRIKQEAKDIHDKYISVPYTTDFGIMFLPVEGLYAEVCKMGLVEILQKEYKINIAGPTTLAALLNSLQMGFKTLAIQKHSGDVFKVLEEVSGEFNKFGELLEKAQENLGKANKNIDDLLGVRTRAMQNKLSKVSKLEENVTKDKTDERYY